MKLEIGKEYVTFNGEAVRILCTDANFKNGSIYTVVGAITDNDTGFDTLGTWSINGLNQHSSQNNLREAGEFLLFGMKTDDPIEVKHTNGTWVVRHFAGATPNGVLTWVGGMTSKTVPRCLLDRAGGTLEYSTYRAYRPKR